uniref:Uncharacterized protein n=1 Tax=Tanacetum cinerariifolium TaxID=118510 RepID=A0A699KIN1_TANCI|nr:hypothetical protein [Tanacetum cinerariifolium]
MPHQRQPQCLTFDAPSQATYHANRDSGHHNYHVTISQLSATILTRKPFARRPFNLLEWANLHGFNKWLQLVRACKIAQTG